MLSQRKLQEHVSYYSLYEFEDIICALDAVALVTRKAVCRLDEIWEKDIHGWKPRILELLKDFDHIFLGHIRGTEAIADTMGRFCTAPCENQQR